MQNRHPKGKTTEGFDSDEKECVWMKANVVNFKLCERDYDCTDCPFDKAMKVAWKQETEDEGTSV